ncbi:hypothetical protein RC1_2147 [Rhodospirillum centenum SW]|uniref:Uncharacterized protein n=1 Tax=Rhodospirillum centenum (strain ATCC 51521 / SW) TaxID=414684 RepID=B6ITZ8_RHOCS|nr:hypothetical protein RC1_2147 [Rhodospirillum centenum SW]
MERERRPGRSASPGPRRYSGRPMRFCVAACNNWDSTGIPAALNLCELRGSGSLTR